MLRLDASARDELVREVTARLSAAAPGSVVALRGSLARGEADEYSDVDMLWEVPDALFLEGASAIGARLGAFRPVESLRSDPDLQNSTRHRLYFVRFAGLPLFYRLDLEMFAASVGRDESCDLDNPAARGDVWSLGESALSNAVLALKYRLRGKDEDADRSLARAYWRLGQEMPGLPFDERLALLLAQAVAAEPAVAELAARVAALATLIGERRHSR